MITKPILAVLLAAATFAGCSSVPTNSGSSSLRGNTFSFMAPKPTQPEFAESNQEIYTVFKDAIAKELAAKGLSQVQGSADYNVGFLIIAGNNAATTSLNEYFGYGRDSADLVDEVHKANASGSKNPNYFEAGTLVIDFVDGKTFKLAKRSTVTQQILRQLPKEQRVARAEAIVKAALADLSVSK